MMTATIPDDKRTPENASCQIANRGRQVSKNRANHAEISEY
jgi:hypothetical protein